MATKDRTQVVILTDSQGQVTAAAIAGTYRRLGTYARVIVSEDGMDLAVMDDRLAGEGLSRLVPWHSLQEVMDDCAIAGWMTVMDGPVRR